MWHEGFLAFLILTDDDMIALFILVSAQHFHRLVYCYVPDLIEIVLSDRLVIFYFIIWLDYYCCCFACVSSRTILCWCLRLRLIKLAFNKLFNFPDIMFHLIEPIHHDIFFFKLLVFPADVTDESDTRI